MGEKWVYLIDEQGCRYVGVNPMKLSSVYDLYIVFSPTREKNDLSLATQKLFELQWDT